MVGPTGSRLTLAEQSVAAELAYYQQVAACLPTKADQALWDQQQACYEAWPPFRVFPGRYNCSLFARYLLERHGYSLHHYMAYHLSPAAWNWWFAQVDFTASHYY